MKRVLFVCFMCGILLCSLAVGRGVIFLSENFERYSENSYPSGFVCAYEGTGLANQKVITTIGPNGSLTKVFRLQGANSRTSHCPIHCRTGSFYKRT